MKSGVVHHVRFDPAGVEFHPFYSTPAGSRPSRTTPRIASGAIQIGALRAPACKAPPTAWSPQLSGFRVSDFFGFRISGSMPMQSRSDDSTVAVDFSPRIESPHQGVGSATHEIRAGDKNPGGHGKPSGLHFE